MWLLLAILIPTIVLVVEGRPERLDLWWCEHVHQFKEHTQTDHHGVH